MENNKEIGKLFKEKMGFLDAAPKEGGWNEIQTELDKKKKKRRFFIPFWFNYAGLFLAGIIISSFIYQNISSLHSLDLFDSEVEKKINRSEQNRTKNKPKSLKKETEINENSGEIISNESEKLNTVNALKTSEKSKNNKFETSVSNQNRIAKNSLYNVENHIISPKNKGNKNIKSKNKIEKRNIITKTQNKKQSDTSNKFFNENSISEQKSNQENLTSVSKKNSSEKSLQNNDSEKVEVKKVDSIQNKKIKNQIVLSQEKDSLKSQQENKRNFTLFAFASPTLSVFNSNKSLLDSRLDSNSEIGLSYGAYLCFEGSERFSFRIGVAKYNLQFITNNALVNTSNYYEINYSTGFSNAFIYSQSNNSKYANIRQVITYIEVPLEAKYKIIDKKISLNGIAGFSYLFLDKNEVYFETSNGAKYNVGSTRDLLKQTIGVNLGIGLDYKITKKIKFNLEPIVKYNLKSSQNTNYSNPFSVNILTGLEYRFGE
jgi:Outer membrane protein beta-barrel domain